MKVADLVKCLPADGALGLIVAIRPNGPRQRSHADWGRHRSVIYDILVKGGVYPFLPSQVEAFNESR